MTNLVTASALDELKGQQRPPCISIYLPTHRSYPDNQQDTIRFRNLLKQAEESLSAVYSAKESKELLKPCFELADDKPFWNCAQDGLAVFVTKGVVRTFRIPSAVRERAIVADSFHLTPLRRFLQTTGRYHVLGLSRDSLHLFEGMRQHLAEIEPAPDIPRTMNATVGPEQSESRQAVSTYVGAKGAQEGMLQGHGGGKNFVDIDTEKFFRAVDRGIWEHHSKPSGLPLLLAALPEHHHLFRKVSQNPQLLEGSIALDPKGVSLDRLQEAAWEVLGPAYRKTCTALTDRFRELQGTGLATENLETIGKAAVEGRVDTLLIAAGQILPGRVDPTSGKIERRPLDDPSIDDLLDDLAEVVEERGGQVQVLESERMPTQSAIVAMLRS